MTAIPLDSARRKRTASMEEPCVSEDAIAIEFARRHADELRYCHDWGQWLRWDRNRWSPEQMRLAFHYARNLAREANREGKAAVGRATTAAGVERFAQADPMLATVSAHWDTDPWLLATPNGTVDLKTGKMRAACPDDHITKCTAVGPRSGCPIWLDFIAQATNGDTELARFLQRVAGYALTGDVREHALFFIHGKGGEGKGVFLNTLTGIMGDYAAVAGMETFAASHADRHPTDLAMLRGARLVTVQETEEGRAWNDVRIKALTGGDPITARFMRQDFFTFAPTFKLVIAGNHKPSLKSVDDAMRRRFNIIPFVHKPAVPDKSLPERLKAEWPGILSWAIEGCLEWQRIGLMPSEVVRASTATYFEEQDSFTTWLDECCDRGPNQSDTTAALFKSWCSWASGNGEIAGSSKAFGQSMTKAGFEVLKNTPGHHSCRGFRGLSVKPLEMPDAYYHR